MKLNKDSIPEIKVVENSPTGVTIDFDNYTKLKFKSRNIKNSTLKGIMTKDHLLNKTNIIFSKVSTLKATNVDFTSVDIKDSHISKTEMKGCKFNDAAFINNLIDTVKFKECTFRMTSITGTHFYNVQFEKCDLSNIVINTCQFINCSFKNCKTSNKIIEMSFLYESYFYKTDIFLETILENFGISSGNLKQAKIKIKSKSISTGKGLNKILEGIIRLDDYNNIEKFKLNYFSNPDILINGSDLLDETFKYSNWIELCAIPKSFSLLLENYSEFLLKSFDENKMPVWGLLKFHTMTGLLLEQKISNSEVYRSISGVHLSMSRFVEQFLLILTQEVLTQQDGKLILLVEGPLNESFYLENLEYYFKNTNLTISNIIKHNSPNELMLTWLSIKDIIPIIAALLATRFKIEFENLKKKEKLQNPPSDTNTLPIQLPHELRDIQAFSLELGFDENESFLYQLKLKVLTPGDLLVNIRLGINTRVLGKLKKILISILTDSGKK